MSATLPIPLAPQKRQVLDVREHGLNPERVIFVGLGATAVCWYRCAMPATFLGADWIGVIGEPPELSMVTGNVRDATQLPNWNDYDVIVLQQPAGPRWLDWIRRRKDRGAKVLFEVDDFLHGIRKLPPGEHDYAAGYKVKRLRDLEACMRTCDGIITSTEYIAHRYRQFNRRLYVCRNGVDTGRYNLTLPGRDSFNVGWAGGTGHSRAVRGWLPAVDGFMDAHADTCFVSIGEPYANRLRKPGRETRLLTVPFTSLETYPAAMTHMDVALAPAGKHAFYRGKSDLRWLEAGALGIPTIADPATYPEIVPGETGFWADSVDEVHELLEQLHADRELGRLVGRQARDYIREKRDIRMMAGGWAEVLLMVLAGR